MSKDGLTLIDRYWSHVNIKSKDECWKWTGCISKDGFGKFNINGTTTHSHILAFKLANNIKILPDYSSIIHTCINNSCCNPNHLKLENLIDRFWSKVDKKGEDECWNWMAGVDKDGYGMFKNGNEYIRTHRFVYSIIYGKIGINLVLHKCDNPSCVNPKHLFLGTFKDNMQDKIKKGRCYCGDYDKNGENNPNMKLTDKQVLAIRYLKRLDLCSLTELSKRFGVSITQIHLIVNRKSRIK